MKRIRPNAVTAKPNAVAESVSMVKRSALAWPEAEDWQILMNVRDMAAHAAEFIQMLGRCGLTIPDVMTARIEGRPQDIARVLHRVKSVVDDDLLEAARAYRDLRVRREHRAWLSFELARLAWWLVLGARPGGLPAGCSPMTVSDAFDEAKKCRGDHGPPDGVDALRAQLRGGRGTMAHANGVYGVLANESRAIAPDSRRTPRGELRSVLERARADVARSAPPVRSRETLH